MKPKSTKILLEEQLIDKVREKPFLWNKKDPDYKDSTKKENAWTQIAEEVGMLNGKESQQLWVALRNQFNTLLRKLNKPTGSAGGSRPYFRHEAAMRFCKDATDTQETFDNLDEHLEETDSPANSDYQVYDVVLSPALPPADGQLETQKLPMEASSSRAHTKFGNKRKLDTFEEKLINIFEDQSKQQQDEFDNFCLALAPKLRRINEKDPAKAAEAQVEIQKVLLKAEFEKE